MKPLVPDGEIIINGNQIEEGEQYINQGKSFSLKEENKEQEIKRTLKLGRKQYGKLGNIRRGSLPICLKRKKIHSRQYSNPSRAHSSLIVYR